MNESAPLLQDDFESALGRYSFRRIQALEIFMALGLAFAGVLFVGFYRLRWHDGDALMQDVPWLMPVVTVAQAAIAYGLWRRDRAFSRRHWSSGVVDPAAVARLGWRSALTAEPMGVCVILFEAWSSLRLSAWAFLALISLAVLALGTVTTDLMHSFFWWINGAGYVFWWVLFFRLFATRLHAHRWFHNDLSRAPQS